MQSHAFPLAADVPMPPTTNNPDRREILEARKNGWPTGLEPATARITIWSSTIELWPPNAGGTLVFADAIATGSNHGTARAFLAR